MIVIEGPDASGKSTLAAYIAQALDAPVQQSEGPPKYPGEMKIRLQRYEHLPPSTIFDRHPVVSEEMYCYALGRQLDIPAATINAFYRSNPTFIYCDPQDRDLSRHDIKEHDSPEHLLALHENFDRLREAYRSWAVTHAHIIYRIGDDPRRVVQFVTDYLQNITDFHRRFDIQYEGPARSIPHDLRAFRIRFMAEELCEYAGVSDVTRTLIQAALHEHTKNDTPLEDQFDALIDLAYVLFGTVHLHGFPFAEGWHRVHRANMTKIRAPSAAHSKRNHSADVIKPSSFRPPDLTDLVRAGSSPCFLHEPPVTDDKEAGGTPYDRDGYTSGSDGW
jgi:predicted HAD superfamily Cof-like phosphohydrolase